MVSGRLSSGVAPLDDALQGLLPGDNVVWVGDDGAPLDLFVESFIAEARRRKRRCVYVRTSSGTSRAPDGGSGLEVFDARRGGKFADPLVLEEALIDVGRRHRHAYVVVESLDPLVARWGPDRAVAFYRRCCPRLFDVYAVAYWTVSSRALGPARLKQIAQVAQCYFEVGARQLKLVKADGRPAGTQGQLLRLQTDGGVIGLSRERALGRLGRGLERLRRQRRLSQADLARLAGVSPSAISQAESARRGLSLDTLLILAENLDVGLDDLLDAGTSVGYTLGRRSDATERVAALSANQESGLRLYAIRLDPGEVGTPPFAAKGTEVVAVAQGLIQVVVGTDTPVLRAGDAIMATREGVRRWRNLLGEPSLLFWILEG